MRAVLIGTWGHYVHVLEDAASLPDFELVGIADAPPGGDITQVIHDIPFECHPQVFADPGKMLSVLHPEVAIVSCRIDCIAPLARQAAEAGCHLICEKPLAIDRTDLRRLWDTVVANGVQCYTMTAGRAHGLFVAARKTVESGRIGRVCLINARKSYKYGNRPAWTGDRSLYGGTIPWVGIHALDYVEAVCSEVPTQVSAFHANLAHPAITDCEDAAVIAARLDSGTMVSISVDLLRPAAEHSHGDDWIRIVGDEGIIEVGIDRGECTLTTQSEQTVSLDPVSQPPYFHALMRGLADLGKAVPDEITGRGFNLTDVSLCARDSADTGESRVVPSGPWTTRS